MTERKMLKRRGRACLYLCTVNSKLFPALTITSCASLCLRLYISVLFTLITASPAFRPAASAGDPVLTCNVNNLTLINVRINFAILKIVFFFSFHFRLKRSVSSTFMERRKEGADTEEIQKKKKRTFNYIRVHAARYTPNAGYCASIHARMLEKRRLGREHERRRRR